MKLPIDRAHVEALVREFPHLIALQDQLRLSNIAEATIEQLRTPEVEFLIELYRQGGPEWSARAAQLSTLRSALNHAGTRFAAQDLENVVPALAQYLLQDAQRGWLFSAQVSTRPLPYVVARVDHTPTSSDESGKVLIELKANARGAAVSQQVRVTSSDIAGKTVPEILVAIVSRCIAMIKYNPPDHASRLRIWQVMLAQFELRTSADLPAELVNLFPDATGRDIKGLAKLVAKYCRHRDAAPTLAVFKRCAIFRGIEQSLAAG